MTKLWDVLGIGTAAVDDLLYVDHFPLPNSKISIEKWSRQGGGQTATGITAAARQGAKTAFCCRLSFDDLSAYTIAELEKEGVDCSPCFRDEVGSPYHSVIIVDLSTHTRTILHDIGSICPPAEVITPELIQRAKVLLLDDNSLQAGIKAAGIAKSLKIPVVADIEIDPPPEARNLLPLVDHLIINAEFGEVLCNSKSCADMASALSTAPHASCVITDGERGCWFSEHGSPAQHIPGFKVSVVDTTGCGDVFHGAFAAAIARGEDVHRSAVIANASAAIKATQPGGRMGIPTLLEVQTFRRNNSAS
jgi:sugar/nucleoside kinase (ribokinase family)